MEKLTPKQQRFVEEYLVDLNATQAAIRAGYSESTATVIASQNLTKLNIQQAIQEAMSERSKRTEITADMVVAELARVGFSNIGHYLKFNASGVTLNDSSLMTDDALRCVSEVTESVSKDGGSVKFKLHDKVSALEKLGRHLGIFKDKVEHSGNLSINWPLPRTALDN